MQVKLARVLVKNNTRLVTEIHIIHLESYSINEFLINC
jgi:hypothetical protein